MKLKYAALFCTAMFVAESANAGLFSRKKVDSIKEEAKEEAKAVFDSVAVEVVTDIVKNEVPAKAEPQEQPPFGEMNYDDELRNRCIRMVRNYMDSEEWVGQKFEGFTELYLTGNDWGRESWNNGAEIYRYCTLIGVREENGVEMCYEWRFKQLQQGFGNYSEELIMGKNANKVYPLKKKD
ncbi:MAG: hypothetical protein MJZ24_06595 [Paludibacteraceae bacterium]|nr:hypothetical protein [Paludibacteraceae bacterium]